MEKLIQQIQNLKSIIKHTENIINFINENKGIDILLQLKNENDNHEYLEVYIHSKLQGKIIDLIYKFYQKEYKRMILKEKLIVIDFDIKEFLLNKIFGG